MRLPKLVARVVPLVFVLAGLALSILRFRAQDDLGGLVLGETGFLLMLVSMVALDRRGAPDARAPLRESRHRALEAASKR